MEGEAIVFDSLEKMDESFQLLWNLLSEDGIKNKIITKELSKNLQLDLPSKLSSKIPANKYPGSYQQNNRYYGTEIQNIVSYILDRDDISENDMKNFLDNCYSKNGTISKYAELTKEILQNRYDLMFAKNENNALATESVSDKKGLNFKLTDIFSDSSLPQKPILLIGSIGAGKTTFID